MHPISKAVKLWCLIGCDPNTRNSRFPQINRIQDNPSRARPHRPRRTTHGKERQGGHNVGTENFQLTQKGPSVRGVQSQNQTSPVPKKVKGEIKNQLSSQIQNKIKTKNEPPKQGSKELTSAQRVQEWRTKVMKENQLLLIRTSNITQVIEKNPWQTIQKLHQSSRPPTPTHSVVNY